MTYHLVHLTPGATVPPQTLGLGVTSQKLALLYDFGNVDGASWSGRSVVDIATEIPLPPDGATLALGCLDLPTVAAAAVLVLRRLKIGTAFRLSPRHCVTVADREPLLRLARIAARDTYRPSAEWQPRRLPTLEQPWPAKPRTADGDRQLAAVAAICAAPKWELRDGHWYLGELAEAWPHVDSTGGGDGRNYRWWCFTDGEHGISDSLAKAQMAALPGTSALSLAERVAIVACWLLWGNPDLSSRVQSWAEDRQVTGQIYRAVGIVGTSVAPFRRLEVAMKRLEASRLALAEARDGVIELHGLCCGLEESSPLVWGHDSDGKICAGYEMDCCGCSEPVDPQVAIVRSSHPDALSLGFCVAPVVVWIESARERCDQCGAERQPWQDAAEARCPAHASPVGSCDGILRAEGPRRVTIAGWPGADGQTRYLDVERLRGTLSRMESEQATSWRPEIWRSLHVCCTPELSNAMPSANWAISLGTRLSEEAIVREVLQCLR